MSDILSDETAEPMSEVEETENVPENAIPGAETSNAIPTEGSADSFPRAVVEKLRKEAAGYRDRAKTAEARISELEHALHTAHVTATGRLADPTDLAYAAEHLDDPDALTAAIDALLETKPHLAARQLHGDAGQGNRGDTQPASWLSLLRGA